MRRSPPDLVYTPIDVTSIRGKDELDVPLTRFVLGRLGQVDSTGEVELVIQNIDRLYPVFTDAIRYLRRLRDFKPKERRQIGKQVIELLNSSIVAHLEYHRLWLLSMFTSGTEWDNEGSFVSLTGKLSDEFSLRKLMLAMGRSNQPEWFRSRRKSVLNWGPWLRRGFLAGVSCLPAGERHHWYQSVERSLDPVEAAVVHWAKGNPFS